MFNTTSPETFLTVISNTFIIFSCLSTDIQATLRVVSSVLKCLNKVISGLSSLHDKKKKVWKTKIKNVGFVDSGSNELIDFLTGK